MDDRVGRMHCRYRVITDSASGSAAAARLDRIAREELAAACQQALDRVLAGDPAVYVLRRLEIRFAVNAQSNAAMESLAERWGASVWKSAEPGPDQRHSSAAMRALEEAGASLRKAVQVSLMEGRPCADRVETALACLRQDLRSQVERELGLLGTRALKPLFLCVAPALFMLLGFGFWLVHTVAIRILLG